MKKVISLILTVLMLFTVLPMSTFAEEVNAPKISVESTDAIPGETFDVNVRINNNPGLVMAELKVEFGSALTLIAAESKDAMPDSIFSFTPPGKLANGGVITGAANFTWYVNTISDSNIRNGVMLKLTFTLSDTAQEGEVYDIKVSSTDGLGDRDLNLYSASTSGRVTVVNYTPGDVNDDKRITMLDVVLLSRYIADGGKTDPDGYNVSINKKAGNVNDDGRINMLDVVLISRYIADGCKTDPEGYNVRLIPESIACTHNLQMYEAKEATCTKDGNDAYWYCSKCHSYFSDENGTVKIARSDTVIDKLGHDPVVIPDVPATPDSAGSQGGTKCSRCGITLIEPTPIPPIEVNEYQVIYDVIGNMKSDDYLKAQSIENPNPVKFTSEAGIERLKDLEIAGYTFDYWCDDDGNKVVKIPKGTEENVYLSAHWTLNTYQIQFDMDAGIPVTVDDTTYSVNNSKILPKPQLDGYTFIGWSDADGEVYKTIPAGTTGNKTYMANWLSKRNQAWTKNDLGTPIIYEDNNLITFTYEIGEIRNVPISVIHDFGHINGSGIEIREISKFSQTVNETCMETYTSTATKATTDSFAFSLSSGWSDSTSVNEEWAKENGMTVTEAEKHAKNSSQNWYTSTSKSKAKTTLKDDRYDQYDHLKTTTKNTKTYDVTDKKTEWDVSAELDLDLKQTIGISVPVDGADISGGYEKNLGLDVKGSYGESTNKKTGTEEDDGSEDTTGKILHKGTTKTEAKSWNSESGYSKSSSISQEDSWSKEISERISEKYGYGKNYIQTENQDETQGHSASESNTSGYSSTVTYSKITSEEKTEEISTANTVTGWHRWVYASTAHVFAVVCYDIKSQEFFTETLTVMDDAVSKFEDYSYESGKYDDNQTGVITFEVPINIADYVADKTGYTEGLQINKSTGTVTGYNGTEKFVVIPEYYVFHNADGTNSAVKVTGISSKAFRNNKDIVAVEMSEFVTEIPDDAFNGCSSLISVEAVSLKKIGKNAFAGCSQLKYATVADNIEELAENAFDNLERLEVKAANASVVQAAISIGAKETIINVSDKCKSSENTDKLDGKELEVPASIQTFVFNGFQDNNNSSKPKTIFENLRIVSNAKKTIITRASFSSTGKSPLQIGSAEVELHEVDIVSPGIALMLLADSTNLSLKGDSNINSSNENAMLCKNISLGIIEESTDSNLNVNGNLLILICGKIENSQYLSVKNGKIIPIEEDPFEKYKKGEVKITLDANGGVCETTSLRGYCGDKLGTLPQPTRQYYVFSGWFTEKNGGIEVTSESVYTGTEDITIYAHWNEDTYNLTLDAAGGTVSETTRKAICNKAIGDLPTPIRQYYIFDGWYTEASGGTKVTSETSFNSDTTVYAHWKEDTYTLTFNANGGSVSESSRKATCNKAVGSLPTPTRTNYNFNGWYTAASGGTKVTSSTVFTNNTTIYAHWSIKTVSMPYLIGKNCWTAKSELESLGLKVNLASAENRTYAPNLVYAQNYSSGSSVNVGSTVTLTYSLGAQSYYVGEYVEWSGGYIYRNIGGSGTWKDPCGMYVTDTRSDGWIGLSYTSGGSRYGWVQTSTVSHVYTYY